MRSSSDVDARSDVWALGTVLHELLAGEPPFQADTMTALCAMILQDPPTSLRLVRPDVPPGLETAILGALEKDRNRRYPNMAAFAFAVARYGTQGAAVSADRIGRILGAREGAGVPAVGAGAGTVPGHETMTAVPEIGPTPPPMSRSVARAVGAGSRAPWVALGVLAGLAVIGVAAAVAIHRSTDVPAAAASVSPAAPAPSPPPAALAPSPPPAAPVGLAPLAPSAATTLPVAPTATTEASPVEPPGSSAGPHAIPPHDHKAHVAPEPHRPAVGGAPSAAPPPLSRPSPSPADPFGEDRKG